MMKKVMSRIWIFAMLTMVSTAAWAQDAAFCSVPEHIDSARAK